MIIREEKHCRKIHFVQFRIGVCFIISRLTEVFKYGDIFRDALFSKNTWMGNFVSIYLKSAARTISDCCYLCFRLDVSVSGSRAGTSAGAGRAEGGLMQTIQSVFSKVIGGGNAELKKQCMNLHI